MTPLTQRPDIASLSSAQIAPLEQHFSADWSDTWREFARSQYCTLLAVQNAAQPDELVRCAELAVALTLGIAQDMGGVQWYIQAGAALANSRKTQEVLSLLASGRSYRDVATATGLTEPSVRRIERIARQQRHAEFSARQNTLPI